MEIISSEQLEQMKFNGDNIVADFYAEWCGPCKMLAPRLDRLSQEYPNVKFVKINIDENGEYVADMGIRSVPTVMFFEGSKKIHTSVGVQSDTYYKEIINQLS